MVNTALAMRDLQPGMPNMLLRACVKSLKSVQQRDKPEKGRQNMGQKASRPLSPHLQIYRWGPQMLTSILHRATGFVLATAGMLTLLWWLAALGGGAESYAVFQKYAVSAGADATGLQIAANWFFRLLALGVTWSFFQHLFSGLRHFILDMGAGYELKASRSWAIIVLIASITATLLVVLVAVWRVIGI